MKTRGARSQRTRIGGPPAKVTASLRIFTKASRLEISRLLELEETEVKGGKKRGDDTVFFFDSPYDGGDLESCILVLLAQLPSSKQRWERLRRRGRPDVFCGVFLNETGASGFSLSPRVMKALGRRGLVVGFDIYS